MPMYTQHCYTVLFYSSLVDSLFPSLRTLFEIVFLLKLLMPTSLSKPQDKTKIKLINKQTNQIKIQKSQTKLHKNLPGHYHLIVSLYGENRCKQMGATSSTKYIVSSICYSVCCRPSWNSGRMTLIPSMAKPSFYALDSRYSGHLKNFALLVIFSWNYPLFCIICFCWIFPLSI